MSRRTGRPGTGERQLSSQRIVETALEIVDREGMRALSMRRLGRELSVDPMAIYHHLPNKQAVIAGMVQHAFDELAQPDKGTDRMSWQDRVRSWAQQYHQSALRHASLFVHLVANADAATDSVMKANDELYAALEASGMEPRNVVRAADMIVDYVHGVILGEGTQPATDEDWRQVFRDRLSNAPQDELPALRRVLGSLDGAALEIDFAFGLDVILGGLERYARPN